MNRVFWGAAFALLLLVGCAKTQRAADTTVAAAQAQVNPTLSTSDAIFTTTATRGGMAKVRLDHGRANRDMMELAQQRGIILPDLPFIERRYKIEAVRFKARDETGIDWWGSDEVMVGTVDIKGTTVSEEIGDIDTGNTHSFDPAKSCIVAVRPGFVVLGKTSVCDDLGEPAPLFFKVEFWEKDPVGLPMGFCVVVTPFPGHHSGTHCANDLNGDDFIGQARADFSVQELEAALPNVGNRFTETIVLSPCRVDEGVCGGDLPSYTFTYRITRLPDVRVGLSSVLAEAMPKIGARTELEAIVVGLRSLRAPSPREIESIAVGTRVTPHRSGRAQFRQASRMTTR